MMLLRWCMACGAACVGVVAGGGCVTQKSTTAMYTSTRSGPVQEREGLSIALEMVSDPQQLNELFGIKSLNKDVVAVHADVRNASEGSTFIIQPAGFRVVGCPDSGARRKSAGGNVLEGVAVAALSPMLVMISGTMKGNASVIQNNMMRREFKARTLQKGESASGFFFFQFPKGQRPPVFQVEVTASEADTGRCVRCEMELRS